MDIFRSKRARSARFLSRIFRKLDPAEKARERLFEASQTLSLQRKAQIIQSLWGEGPPTVLNGPFRGMKYISESSGSQLLPKLLGSYEEPIHQWIGQILSDFNYGTVVDVGCAEGYYAVGLTMAMSRPKVLAFDIDKAALDKAKHLAEINNVSVSFAEIFDEAVLANVFRKDENHQILIFMDVEGAEIDLLDPQQNPQILKCDVLVELHDCFFPGLTEKVVSYFAKTHRIQIVFDYPWREGKYAASHQELEEGDLRFMMDEKRPPMMRWMSARKR